MHLRGVPALLLRRPSQRLRLSVLAPTVPRQWGSVAMLLLPVVMIAATRMTAMTVIPRTMTAATAMCAWDDESGLTKEGQRGLRSGEGAAGRLAVAAAAEVGVLDSWAPT